MRRLIVNADDYGYFPEVSRGIREAAAAGAVTATGILANGPAIKEDMAALAEAPGLDLGVHLNLTHGHALSAGMARLLAPSDGIFPGKWPMLWRLATGAIPRAAVAEEWDAQIRRCGAAGRLLFLNSHEHIHMLPMLYGLTRELARTHGIAQVRRVRPEGGWYGLGPLVRDLLLGAVSLLAPRPDPRTPRFIGLGASGRLSLAYLRERLSPLQSGAIYELMCHPGQAPAGADRRLRAYHDWEGELRLLTSPEVRELFQALGIRLARYSELESW